MSFFKEYITSITPFSEESWCLLCSCLTKECFSRKESILKEGQVCKAVYFVVSGLCKASYNAEGKEINTAFYPEKHFFTNIQSIRQGVGSAYDLKACEPSTVLRIDRARLLEAYRLSHEIEALGRKVLEQISAHSEEEVNTFRLLTPRQRYENLLARQPHLCQRLSQTELASYLGTSRESISRFRARK